MIYGQDTRTTKQMLDHYKQGKKAEELILQKLEEYFWVEKINDTDKAGEFSKYCHDAEIGYGDKSWKLEIKFTKQPLTYVEWKSNQFEFAKQHNVSLLQIAGGKIALIRPWYKGYYKEKGYCNKSVYSFKPMRWFESFAELREHLINN